VRSGGYTSTSEVVRDAIRQMQEEEAREAGLARSTAQEIINGLTASQLALARKGVVKGVAAIERGEYTEYTGREGLDRLAADVKARGRRILATRTTKK
jgi:putative addiction module CopG family antidote